MESAKVQGFNWNQSKYEFNNDTDESKSILEMQFDENLSP